MKLEYQVFQRREAHLDQPDNRHRFYVTTVISKITDLDTGTVIPIPPVGEPSLLNLFIIDGTANHGSDLLGTVVLKRTATPEDYTDDPPALGTGVPLFKDLTRAFFQSETDTDPTDSSEKPYEIELMDVVSGMVATDLGEMYASNILITRATTLADAEAQAGEALKAVSLFARRYNELTEGFSTMSQNLPSGYMQYDV